MSQNRLMMAQDVFENTSRGMSGFNMRVLGGTYQNSFAYPSRPDPAEVACFWLADDMIKKGKIYYTQIFRHSVAGSICRGTAFNYGGTWVCNACNNSHVDRPWWKVKVYQDGNAWCCVGLEFENLQESDNYAFGLTRGDSLRNYETMMIERDNAVIVAGKEK